MAWRLPRPITIESTPTIEPPAGRPCRAAAPAHPRIATAHPQRPTDTTTTCTRTHELKQAHGGTPAAPSSLPNMRRPARPQASGSRVLVMVLPALLLLALGPGQAAAVAEQRTAAVKVCTR